MFPLHKHSFGTLALAIATLTGNAQALNDASSKTNLVMYWGQGPDQLDLLHYCQQSAVDIIPVGFVHVFPAEDNCYPGSNFGNKCGPGVFSAPGPDSAKDRLLSNCPSIDRDIPICQQSYGKKIILCLGGGTRTYTLTDEQQGRDFADVMWGVFGPQTPQWLADGKPRPFEGPNGEEFQVDGFDMDIEFKPTAPQCVVPDDNMAQMISAIPFDIIFIQFYNTLVCSARDYITNGANSQFNFEDWSDFLVGTASANAKLYIGLPDSPDAAGQNGIFWLNPSEAQTLIEDFYDRENFGGVMLWESTRAEARIDDGRTYYDNIKQILADVSGVPSSSIFTISTATIQTTTVSSTVETVSSTISTTTATFPSTSGSNSSGTSLTYSTSGSLSESVSLPASATATMETTTATVTSVSTLMLSTFTLSPSIFTTQSSSSPSPTGLRFSTDGSCGNGVNCGRGCCSRTRRH